VAGSGKEARGKTPPETRVKTRVKTRVETRSLSERTRVKKNSAPLSSFIVLVLFGEIDMFLVAERQ
jgi:hypothetical protein